MNTLADTTPLPPLRQELRLEPADAAADGAPRWRLFDPMRERFFVVADEDMKLLSLWGCGQVGALRRTLALTGSRLDDARLGGLIEFLQAHQLVLAADAAGVRELAALARASDATGLRWLLSRYLGMRFVLWHPQAFLEDTLPLARGLFSRPVLALWALLTLTGLGLVARQWDQFLGTFADWLTPGGAAVCAVALLGLKLVHELGHAYAAVHHGARVSSMGVAVSMGVPMLYTDTTDAHRLASRRGRIAIGVAGVGAESLVAGLATFAWAVLPDGPLRALALVLATSSWLTSLVVNLNPLGRFDGYHVLSDALRIDNLQTRALDRAGWWFGRLLFGALEAPPEPLPRRQAIGFVAYGAAVWCYRMSLYLGAAWLAWRFLGAALALLPVAAALWVLVAAPIARRSGRWWSLRSRVGAARRAGLVFGSGALLLAVLLPLDAHVSAPAVLGWEHETLLQVPEAAEVAEVLVRSGDPVRAGQVLLRLRSPDLAHKQLLAQASESAARVRLDRTAGDRRDRVDSVVIEQQRLEAATERAGLQARSALLDVTAPADGTVVDLPPALQPGRWVRPETPLGRVLHGARLDVRGYIAERDLRRVAPGAVARFVADDLLQPALPLALARVEATSAETIAPDLLASQHGGPLASRADDRGRSIPVGAQFAARFRVVAGADAAGRRALPTLLRGEVSIEARAESLAMQSARQLWRLGVAELRQ